MTPVDPAGPTVAASEATVSESAPTAIHGIVPRLPTLEEVAAVADSLPPLPQPSTPTPAEVAAVADGLSSAPTAALVLPPMMEAALAPPPVPAPAADPVPPAQAADVPAAPPPADPALTPTVIGSLPTGQTTRDDPPTPRTRASGEHKAPTDEGRDGETARAIGPYLVLERIGTGGMGEVFRGEGPDGTAVAIKVLGAAGDDASRTRFDREGAVLERLNHPNVVRLLARGVDPTMNRAWIALELVRGRDLEELLASRPDHRLSIPEAAHVVGRLADALATAHAVGVLHRDVKPANVLLTPGGRVLLSDFGIALTTDVSVRLTRDELLGTPAYLAPEVVLGEPWSEVADVYGLGALAFRALIGRPPFEGASAEDVLADRITSDAPRVRELRPEVPASLADLVDRLLGKTPEARPLPSEVAVACAALCTDPTDLGELWRSAAPSPTTTDGATPIGRGRALQVGERFLHYRVERELGRGAMGVVYEAFHAGLKKRVALKVMLAGALASVAEQRRFLREAHAAASLDHPYVVPVLDAGEHEGVFYLVMDLVDGQPLGAWSEGAPPEEARLQLFSRLCEGVQHAHQRGVIHRDLKPDNVLVSGDGAPHVLDFGVARTIGEQDEAEAGDPTREGAVVGTLRYMPPEQASGKVAEVDVRSDVYALGTILYELLTGTTPFRGSTREVLSQILFKDPRPPSEHRPGLPWELDAICLKALEKRRDDRYQSASELRADLERFRADVPIQARQGSAGYRVKKWAVRNRAAVLAGSGAATIVLLLAGGWTATVLRARSERDAQVLAAVQGAWGDLARGEPQLALDKLSASRELLGPDDVLRLPDGGADGMPEVLATALDPEERSHPRVTQDRLRAWAAHARLRRDGAEVERLVVDARRALERKDLSAAAQAAALAARIGPDSFGVRAAGDEVVRALLSDGRRALDGARGAPLGERRAHLERARATLEDARRIDSTSDEVQAALLGVHEALGHLNEAEQARALHERELAQAAALVGEGARSLARDDLETARRAFEQALAFDGTSDGAQAGLVEVSRRLDARKRLEEERAAADRAARAEREKREQAATLRRKAEEALLEGRERFQRGDLPPEVRERYLASMEGLRQSLFLVPDDEPTVLELRRVAREFSSVLIDQGDPELALFMLRVGGADPEDRKPIEVPRDAHVAVVEADAVNIRRAFGGGAVHFLPSSAFDKLRSYVRSQTDRFRFLVEVRATIEVTTATTRVMATGLRVRMEDRVAGTVTPPVDFRFEGGPFLRPVFVSPQGPRLVRPWNEAQGLDWNKYVKLVEGQIQQWLQRAKR